MPLADLVAPPYDAVSQEERERLYTRSPYNVVHLTLPDSAEDAGRLYRSWLSDGILEHEDEPAAWFVVEEYAARTASPRAPGHRRIARRRAVLETGRVLPHERTYRADRRGAAPSSCGRPACSPEPLFLLVDGPLGVERPTRDPDARGRTARGSGGFRTRTPARSSVTRSS